MLTKFLHRVCKDRCYLKIKLKYFSHITPNPEEKENKTKPKITQKSNSDEVHFPKFIFAKQTNFHVNFYDLSFSVKRPRVSSPEGIQSQHDRCPAFLSKARAPSVGFCGFVISQRENAD